MISIERRWIDALENVNKGLFVVYNEEFSRLQIKHKDDRTGLIRNVMFVQDLDGKPCSINDNLIVYLKRCVEWDRMGQYPEPEDIYKSIVKDMEEHKRKRDLERQGYYLDFNKAHRKEWKSAMNTAMQDKNLAAYLKKEAAKQWATRKISNNK